MVLNKTTRVDPATLGKLCVALECKPGSCSGGTSGRGGSDGDAPLTLGLHVTGMESVQLAQKSAPTHPHGAPRVRPGTPRHKDVAFPARDGATSDAFLVGKARPRLSAGVSRGSGPGFIALLPTPSLTIESVSDHYPARCVIRAPDLTFYPLTPSLICPAPLQERCFALMTPSGPLRTRSNGTPASFWRVSRRWSRPSCVRRPSRGSGSGVR